jgi:two-component system chemotaxis response regulator CheB
MSPLERTGRRARSPVLEAFVISVLVVDDSVVIRRLITDALSEDNGIHVVGTAPNGKVALAKIEQLQPDLVTLDIEMPIMDGVATLRAIRANYPYLPVIMFSTLTATGATATLDALAAGANDYVTKPANVGSIAESIRSVREQIIPRIHALCGPKGSRPGVRPLLGGARREPLPNGQRGPLPGLGGAGAAGTPSAFGTPPPAGLLRPRPTTPPVPGPTTSPLARPAASPPRTAPTAPASTPTPATAAPARPLTAPARVRGERVDILAVGCSTGGPDALTKVLRSLPGDFPVPVVVVQHMPPVFTKMFAERLDRTCALTVMEAQADVPLRPGSVYIAPGDLHLEVARRGAEVVTKLHAGPPENFCRPAVDVLFRSVARTYIGSAIAVILTGMGQDGKRGAEQLREAGAEIVAQDEASSVVWGMPGAVANAGLAHAVLPLDDIAGHLVSRVPAVRGVPSMEVTR